MDRALLMKPDYSAQPFWRRDGANVSLLTLPLSEETREGLRAWTAWFESSAYWEHSTADELRYFASDDEEQDFETEGLRLWLAVRAEVGSEWLIGYQSLMRRERVWDPASLPSGVLPHHDPVDTSGAPSGPLPPVPVRTEEESQRNESVDMEKLASSARAPQIRGTPVVAQENTLPEHPPVPVASLPHEERLVVDPLYREAYERTMREFDRLAGAPPESASSPEQSPAPPESVSSVSPESVPSVSPSGATEVSPEASPVASPEAPGDEPSASSGSPVEELPDFQDLLTNSDYDPGSEPSFAALPSEDDAPSFDALPSEDEAPTFDALPSEDLPPSFDALPPEDDSEDEDPTFAALPSEDDSEDEDPTFAALPSEDDSEDDSEDEDPTFAALPSEDDSEDEAVFLPRVTRANAPSSAVSPGESAPYETVDDVSLQELPHEERFRVDPVYRAGYERALVDLGLDMPTDEMLNAAAAEPAPIGPLAPSAEVPLEPSAPFEQPSEPTLVSPIAESSVEELSRAPRTAATDTIAAPAPDPGDASLSNTEASVDSTTLPHEQRLQSDPAYRDAYEARLAQLLAEKS